MATQTVNIDVQVKTQTLGQLEDTLAEINEELKQVDRNSQAFTDLTKQAQMAEKELAKVNDQIAGFTAEDKFEAADGAIKLFTGALQGAVGALGMFGVESEVFAEFEKKAASAIALGMGLKDLSEGYGKLAKSFKKATGAQLGFNAATLLNPYVMAGAAIVAVVGALAFQFDNFSKILKEAGLGTVDLSSVWNSLSKVFSGVTNVIASRLGNLVAGIGHLLNGRFKKAGQSFSKLGVRGTIEAFKEGSDQATARQVAKQGKKAAEAFEEARQEELKKLQKQWLEDEQNDKLQQEWYAEGGKDAAMSFQEAFEKQLKEEPIDYGYIDPNDLDDLNALWEEGGMIYEFTKNKQDALNKLVANVEFGQQFVETATQAFDIIEEMGTARYERQLLNLERERSNIENNIHLSEEERIAALESVERKERQIEIRRIKAERDMFTIKQTLLIAENALKTSMFILDLKREGMKALESAKAAGTEVATTAAVQVAKAQTSLGAFTAALGPFGIAAFALSIGGIIASIVSARKAANSQIASLTGMSVGGGSTPTTNIPAAPPTIAPAQDVTAQPMMRAYVVSGDTRSAQEADAKILTRRTLD